MMASAHSILNVAENPLASTSRSEEHTSELQSQSNLVCRLLLEKKKNILHTVPIYIFTNCYLQYLSSLHSPVSHQHESQTIFMLRIMTILYNFTNLFSHHYTHMP